MPCSLQLTCLVRLELQYNGFERGPPAVVGDITSLQVSCSASRGRCACAAVPVHRSTSRASHPLHSSAHPAAQLPALPCLQELNLSGNLWGSEALDLPREYAQLRRVVYHLLPFASCLLVG